MCLLDRVEEADVQTQTDAFLDRPSTPLFVPAKTGMDAATQIEEGDVSYNYSHSFNNLLLYQFYNNIIIVDIICIRNFHFDYYTLL